MLSSSPAPLKLKEITNHIGEPALEFTESEIHHLSTDLQLTLIGKFTTDRPSMDFLRRGFKTIGFKGDYLIGLMDDRHVLIRFQLQEDYQRCWLHQTWNFKTHTMRVLKWTPFFHKDEEPPLAPIWVAFENLPLFMFKKEALFSAGQIIGKPLKMDAATETLSRPSVARLCVEVDLIKPLPRRFWIGHGSTGFWQSINYECIPEYCWGCRRFGHSDETCGQKEWRPKNKATSENTKPTMQVLGSSENGTALQKEIELDIAENQVNLEAPLPSIVSQTPKATTQPERQIGMPAAMVAIPEINNSVDATPEVIHSVIPMDNRTDLQNNILELNSVGKPFAADCSMATNGLCASEDISSTQSVRENAKPEKLLTSESSDQLPCEPIEETEGETYGPIKDSNAQNKPAGHDVPVLATLRTVLSTIDATKELMPTPQVSIEAQQVSNPFKEASLNMTTKETSHQSSSTKSVHSADKANSPQKSTLNAHAVQFHLTTKPNLGVSPVASAPSPSVPHLNNDDLLNSTTKAISAPELMEHIGMNFMYQPFEINTQNHFLSLQASDEEEEDEDEQDEFLDNNQVHDDSYLDHLNAQRKAREREELQVQFRRGRGRPPGSRRTYFDVSRTMKTRSRSFD